jgi:hypothetical protein
MRRCVLPRESADISSDAKARFRILPALSVLSVDDGGEVCARFPASLWNNSVQLHQMRSPRIGCGATSRGVATAQLRGVFRIRLEGKSDRECPGGDDAEVSEALIVGPAPGCDARRSSDSSSGRRLLTASAALNPDDRADPDPAAADRYIRCGRSRTAPVRGEYSTW